MGPLPTRWRKVGTTSNHHAPYDLGYTRNTMAVNNGKRNREVERNLKNGLSSDRRLQPACVKLELLVIADQHAAVNTFPGLVHTARHTMGVCNTRNTPPVTPWEFVTPEVSSLTVRRALPKVG